MDFSIITPSFRSSTWLPLCIASVADQEGVKKEHIVQDSCSDDGTLDWLPNDPRVTAYVERDSGMYDAVNRGFARASGDVLAYLNCDEQYLPGTLRAVADYFEERPDVELVFADTVVVDRDGEFICFRKAVLPSKYFVMTSHLPVFTCSMFMRRRVFTDYGLQFNPGLKDIGDVHWVLTAINRGVRIGLLSQYTSAFADTGENMNLHPNAQREMAKLRKSAPAWARLLRIFIVGHHRLRRLYTGAYRQDPFAYDIFTGSSPNERVRFQVEKPTFLWRSRFRLLS